jgi:hypothetical protein
MMVAILTSVIEGWGFYKLKRRVSPLPCTSVNCLVMHYNYGHLHTVSIDNMRFV